MTNLVSVEVAALSLGTTLLLDGVSCGILDGDRIGVVGRNGGGKSTLLRVLAGTQRLDSGRIARGSGLTTAMLPQLDDLPPEATVRDIVVGRGPEHAWAGDARVRDIVAGLLGDLDARDVGGLHAPVGPLSGGERRRVSLAGLLVADPDLLLLDEPTNHLDVEGVAWLAEHLATRRPRPGSALVVVTHDRWFLDAVATATWEVVDGRVEGYDGGYAAYVLAKAERARVAAVTAERRDNLLRKELAWLRRGAPARTSKPKFRLDAAMALIEHEPPPRDDVSLVRFAARRLGKDVVDLLDATISVPGLARAAGGAAGEDPPARRVLLDKVTWRLAPGERIGVVGVNGAGKSTLMRAIHGDLALDAGTRKVGKTVVMAYLSQDVDELGRLADARVIDAITDVRAVTRLGDKEVTASQLAQRLGFSGGRQQHRVADLSGGERRRLQLLRLLMREPNVLLLDEPTNDLDIETLTSVEDVLDGWPGTLLVVSHDRYLLERMCDRQVALLGDGTIRDLPGGVDEYLELRRRARSAEDAPRPPRACGGGAAPVAGASAAEQREARKEMARVERALARLAEREGRLHEQMVAKATDHAAVLDLNAALREIVDERETLELAWLAAAETCEG